MRFLLFTITLLTALASPALAQRLALVVGNAAYERVDPLQNTENDARDIAAALSDLGFDVTLAVDLDYNGFRAHLRAFQRRAATADVTLVYYAGHGVEIDGENYLIPTDAELDTADAVSFEAIPLRLMLRAAAGARALSLVVVDACRNNPFVRTMATGPTTRSIGRGLTVVEPSGNTLIAYAAKDGTTALDGEGRNSPYARAFLDQLARPRLEIGKFFRAVRDQVIQDTNGRQEPFLYGSLSAEDFFLNETDPKPNAALLETTLWSTIHDSDTAEDFVDFLALYPDGPFAPFARRRLGELRTIAALPDDATTRDTQPDVTDAAEAPPLPPDPAPLPSAPEPFDTAVLLLPPGQSPEPPQTDAASPGDTPAPPPEVDLALRDLDTPTAEEMPTDAPEETADAAPETQTAQTQTNQTQTNQTTEPDPDPVPEMTRAELILATQTQLDTLGCEPGPADGIWGPQSRAALIRYAEATDTVLPEPKPNPTLLAAMQGQTGRICPLTCGPRYVISGDNCALKTCPSGQQLSSSGTCYTPKPKVAAPRRSGSARPVCSVYNGIRLCN